VTDARHLLGAAWAPAQTTPKRNQQPLSREQIVEGAIHFLQKNRLEELSMRRLAAELNTKATSLYWHVANKEVLLDLVLDHMFGEVHLPEGENGWTEDITAVMSDLRRVLRAYRTAAHLVVSRPTVGPQTLRVFEFVLSALQRAGFEKDIIPLAYDLLTNYTIGSVLVESSWFSAHGSDSDEVAQGEEIAHFLRSLPEEDFPTLTAFSDTLFRQDEDAKFTFGLKRLLAGLAVDLEDAR